MKLLLSLAITLAPLAANAAPPSRLKMWNLTPETLAEIRLAPAGTTAYGPNQALNDKDRTVDFDEQDSCRIPRVAGTDIVFDRSGDLGVHHLECGRYDAARDDPGDGPGRILDRREVEQHRAHDRWIRREAHEHASRDPHGALTADEATAEVVAGMVGLLTSEPGRRPVRQDDIEREHVCGRHPVREAVRAARVGRDVAPDRARLLRGRVRRVVQAEMPNGTAQVVTPAPGTTVVFDVRIQNSSGVTARNVRLVLEPLDKGIVPILYMQAFGDLPAGQSIGIGRLIIHTRRSFRPGSPNFYTIGVWG